MKGFRELDILKKPINQIACISNEQSVSEGAIAHVMA